MFQVKLSDKAIKDLNKLDKRTSKLIIHWIEKNLVNCVDPRQHGKALKGNLKGFWRYRVGDYRLFADIQDDVLIIETLRLVIKKQFRNEINR